MPRRYSMDRRSGDFDLTRRQILDAVVDVVADVGLDALTVQAVAARADVALRTVYNHFESREGLIAAALGDLTEQTRAAVRSIIVAERSGRHQLLAFADAYLHSYEQQGNAVRVLMNASSIPGVSAAIGDVRTWRRQQIRSMLRQARTDDELNVPLAEAVNIAYLATAYSTYASLTMDLTLSPGAARATVRTMLDRSLFDA